MSQRVPVQRFGARTGGWIAPALGLGVLLHGLAAAAAPPVPALPQNRPALRLVDRMNREFMDHLQALHAEHTVAVAVVREGWAGKYKDAAAESFIPDALAVLYPAYRAGLEDFDAGRPDAALRRFEPLVQDSDPYLAANALYFAARARVDRNEFEEIVALLPQDEAGWQSLVAHTPYAAHLRLIQAFALARTLRFEAAAAALPSDDADAPEMVRMAARQLRLELERRKTGSLDEAADTMEYVADRLGAASVAERVVQRQERVIELLDQLINDMQQQEQQAAAASASGAQPDGGQRPARGAPTRPLEESRAPEGAGQIGELHGLPRARPGEAWGKLPPAERERILQTIRERYPSRYRELVEQYYRTLAEDQ